MVDPPEKTIKETSLKEASAKETKEDKSKEISGSEVLIDDIRKLPPLERIKKLKEVEQKLKENIDSAEKLIEQSAEEIEEQEETKRKIPINELMSWEIQEFFAPEARLMWQTKRFRPANQEMEDEKKTEKAKAESKRLEQQVESGEGRWTTADVQREIQNQMYNAQKELSYMPMEQLYSQVQQLYSNMGSTPTQDMLTEKYTLLGVLEMKARAFEEGSYRPEATTSAQEVFDLMDGARQLLLYTSGQSGRKEGPSDDLKTKPS